MFTTPFDVIRFTTIRVWSNSPLFYHSSPLSQSHFVPLMIHCNYRANDNYSEKLVLIRLLLPISLFSTPNKPANFAAEAIFSSRFASRFASLAKGRWHAVPEGFKGGRRDSGRWLAESPSACRRFPSLARGTYTRNYYS